jgi:hypothetical protein
LAATQVVAFDHQDFCIAVKQLTAAAEGDVGVWIDRTTRNAGMRVDCAKKEVEFVRFSYIPSASMTDTWKAARVLEWSTTRCGSSLWKDAIDNGWSIVLDIASADGGHARLTAQCRNNLRGPTRGSMHFPPARRSDAWATNGSSTIAAACPAPSD